VFLGLFAAVVFFAPELNGYFLEHANFEPADRLKTPEHIAPVWYFTPFYAILRAVPDKLGGVVAMGLAVFVLFLLPWLDRSPVRSIRYKSTINKVMLALFAISFIALGYLGLKPVTPLYTLLSRIFSLIYFAFFLGLPFFSRMGKFKTVPERVTWHD
jgi:ubiquinol-cytochrome c reductase cytochrome b subunit